MAVGDVLPLKAEMEYTIKQYDEFKLRLIGLSDEKYRRFNEGLIPGAENTSYGVRVPHMRGIAKEIAREADWRGFLSIAQNDGAYEARMISGMIIAYAKCGLEERLQYLKDYIPLIDNWAVCDTVCASMKWIAKERGGMYDFLLTYLSSTREFELRFAIVSLMNYFLTDEYIDEALRWYGAISHDGYYVKMAIAWGLSVCFVKYRDKTLGFLNTRPIDNFTYNKAIQKMLESYRVSGEDKTMLRGMKRRQPQGRTAPLPAWSV